MLKLSTGYFLLQSLNYSNRNGETEERWCKIKRTNDSQESAQDYTE